MPKELALQGKIRKHLKTVPHCWNVKVKTADRQGIPDVLVCFRGYFIAFEVKRTSKDQATKIQQYELDKIEQAQGFAFVVSSVAEVKVIIDRLSKQLPSINVFGLDVQPFE